MRRCRATSSGSSRRRSSSSVTCAGVRAAAELARLQVGAPGRIRPQPGDRLRPPPRQDPPTTADTRTSTSPLPFYAKKLDGRLPPKQRVLAFFAGGRSGWRAPYSSPRSSAESCRRSNVPLAVPFPATASRACRQLPPRIEKSRDVGAASAFDRRVAGRELRFVRRWRSLLDAATRSRWDPASGCVLRIAG